MASNRILWLVRARARQSDLLTSSQLDAWPGPKADSGRRLFRACFATDLSFKKIHVDARAGYVMAARGAGGAAGPAPRHQPSRLPSQVK